MSLDEAIAGLVAELSTRAERGDTSRGSSFASAANHQFERCECSYADRAYGWQEYIAVGTNGRLVVAINLNHGRHFGKITIGANGYHTRRNRQPACR